MTFCCCIAWKAVSIEAGAGLVLVVLLDHRANCEAKNSYFISYDLEKVDVTR